MTDQKQIPKQIDELIEELITLNQTVPVIVEGKRDMAALRSIGLTGKIITLSTGGSIFELCESINANEVIVLTDWDRKGGTLFRRIRDSLRANNIKCNHEFRAKLFALTKKEIKDVESLKTLVERYKHDPKDRCGRSPRGC